MLGLLIHVLLLSDQVRACPEELNPLSLDPPKVVNKYGEKSWLNCTSTTDEHDGMYWSDENVESGELKDSTFVEKLLLFSSWNITATCKIKLIESFECSRDVEITVYKNPDEVILHPPNPDNVMVEEINYNLVCEVINVTPVQNLTVTWYKDKQIVTKTHFNHSSKMPQNVTAILPVTLSREKKEKKEKKEVEFSCEAKLDFEDQIPVSSKTLDVWVHYAPEFTNKTDDVLEWVLGKNLTLNCEADGNPSPVYQWTSGGKVLGNTTNLTIAQELGNVTYTCTAANSVGNITKEIHVHMINNITTSAVVMTTPEASTPEVTYCPIELTPDKRVVRFGDPVTINCSTSDSRVSGMGWEAVSGGTGLTDLTFITWNVEKLEIWNPEPMCFINIDDRQCSAKPSITVYKPPDNVTLSAVVPGPMVEGNVYELRCDIVNVAPVEYLTAKLYQGNKTVGNYSNTTNKSKTPEYVSHTWTLKANRSHNALPFTCKAELHLGAHGPEALPSVTSDPYTAVVHYKPMMGACESHYAGVEHEFSLDKLPCKADGNPPPTVVWFYQGKPFNASKPLTRAEAGKYTAEIRNDVGSSNISVHITVEYAPSFTCDSNYEVKENAELQSVMCEAQAIPSPTITWYKDGQKMGSQLRLTKHDSGNYLLKATNKHGTAQHTLRVDVLYAPTFKKQDKMKPIHMGENVTFKCHAEGNPEPVINLNFTSAHNVFVTTGGSQKIISITEATSTNAGDYICVATNKVGTATRSVTVKIQDGSSGGIDWVKIALIISTIILAIIILVIIVVLYLKHKNSGQYSFVPVPIPLNNRA